MRVLIVSHNVFGKTNNMGKTLLSYFSGFQPEEIAQFYIHSEVPTDDTVCRNYFRFTDRDALKSLIPVRRYGRAFGRNEIQTDRFSSRVDSGVAGSAYQLGSKRTAGIYAMRNLLWKAAHWETREFWSWVDDFSPDVIFFASGDYSFSYDIACAVADHTGKPLIVLCVDDYYLYNKNAHTALGRLTHRLFMKTVRKTMDRASELYVISESMQHAYETLFQKPCRVLHTPAVDREVVTHSGASRISYIGNLGLNRHRALIQMGQAIKDLNEAGCPRMIDVYSAEKDPMILKTMTEENGIRFHGMISPDEVLDVMGQSMAVIHTESFDPDTAQLVRFSVSTKIAESLMYGPCLIAFGPGGVASIDYLKQHKAAYVIDSPEMLSDGLRTILTDPGLREQIVENARALAQKNHNADLNSANIRRWMKSVIR